jgi:dipeptide/tripeptide permease
MSKDHHLLISILWQVPQIAIITAAEILFSITGYEFTYSQVQINTIFFLTLNYQSQFQSGASMKSIMQALWFLTIAIGDCIIIAGGYSRGFELLKVPI